ncbi:MAG: transglycosylase SLT domain-containing protein [Armatimonadetes bacterium]|nr:transglycosylase SLT domain-containing protein [Armatimonadota bacterium]
MKRLVVLAAIPFAYWAWQTDLRGREHRLLEQVSTIEAQNAQLRLELDRAAENQLTGRPLVEKLCGQAVKIEGLDWDEEQIEAMVRICWRESRYNPIDQNRESTAYGLYQFLNSTWPDYGFEKTSDPLFQTVAAVRYIEHRYGTPTEALAFHRELHTVNGKQVHYY